jgi:1,4-dihydroxy-2-naphthoate octaprenyltransferase
VPLLVESGRVARSTYESPRAFVPAVRNIVACYLVAVLLLTAGIIVQAGWPLRP